MAWRGRARGVLPLALSLLAAAEALRPAGAVLNARGSTHPEPPRLRTAAYGPTRREHTCSIMRHLAECLSASRTSSISQAALPTMGGISPLVLGVEVRTASADQFYTRSAAARR